MKQNVAQRSFQKAVEEAKILPWQQNWDIDKQIGNLTTAEYQDLARELRVEMLKKVKDLLTLAPKAVLKDDGQPPHYKFYKLDDMDTLIAQIQANPADPRFLKSTESIAQKMRTLSVNQVASNIGDYLRFQVLSNDIDEIVKLRAIMLRDDSPVTSYKDQFRRPCEEGGHRAFKFHMEILGSKKLVIEGQIGHLGLEELDLVKNLRNNERNLQDVFAAAVTQLAPYLRPIVLAGMRTASDNFMKARLAMNYYESRALGLDPLLDKGIDTQHEIDDALASIDATDPHARVYTERSQSMEKVREHIQPSRVLN